MANINKRLLKVLSHLVFSGDLLKLSDHPKYRKGLEKTKRKQKNEEILREMSEKVKKPEIKTPYEKKLHDKVDNINKTEVGKISDRDLRNFLEDFRDTENEYSDFNLMLDRDFLNLAADYIKGAGALDLENAGNPEECESILERLKTYSNSDKKRDEKALLSEVEIWDDEDGDMTCFIPWDDIHHRQNFIDDNDLRFYVGYDKEGVGYRKSILEEEAG